MNAPEPVDETPQPEIRGGNRPADFIPENYAFDDAVQDDCDAYDTDEDADADS
jgi:hypothetical protein